MNKIRAGIAGAAGYTGGELIRLLTFHPKAEIVFAHSKSQAGRKIYDVHTDLLGDSELTFSDSPDKLDNLDVLFLCVGHGESKKFLLENSVPDKVKVIDLSQDHRLDPDFIYGLPELNRSLIRNHFRIANPGCFATGIQLALLPLAKEKLLTGEVHISATTGSTGAGQAPADTTHYSWREGNHSHYKAFHHQHLPEIRQSLKNLDPDFNKDLHFVPYRGSFTRGIISTLYTETALSGQDTKELYHSYYNSHPFVHVSENPIDLKQVANTNKCFIHLEKHGNKILLTSIIDNLLKGASGQAVQNMNITFGIEETLGLRLKPSAF